MRFALSLGLLFLGSCAYTSQFRENPIADVNAQLSQFEARGTTDSREEDRIKLLHLYSDQPDILDLINRSEAGRSFPRLRIATPPAYPLGPHSVSADLRLSFVVDEKGRVIFPRIVEATDSRFAEAALKAVQRWTFYPGSNNGAPDRFLIVINIKFERPP